VTNALDGIPKGEAVDSLKKDAGHCYDLLENMLQIERDDRPSLDGISEHKFIKPREGELQEFVEFKHEAKTVALFTKLQMEVDRLRREAKGKDWKIAELKAMLQEHESQAHKEEKSQKKMKSSMGDSGL